MPQNQYLLAVAVVAALLSLIEILDFFELPFESSLSLVGASAVFSALASSLLPVGYMGLFVLMFLESLSLPIPSEVFLPMAGYLVFTGKISFGPALAVATLGGLLGSLAIFYLALILGRPIVYSLATKLGVSRNSLGKSEKWLSGKGSLMVFVARFIPGIRSSISIPAGALKMDVLRFSIVTVLGSLGWSFILMYIGYSIGPASKFSSPISSGLLDQIGIYVVAILSISYVVHFLYRKFKMKTSSTLPARSESLKI